MSVYIDGAKNSFRGMVMCHMIADTFEELHATADAIGMRRSWFQSSPAASFPHYDVAKGKRSLAIEAGAIEVTARQMVDHMARLRPIFGIYGRGNPAPGYKP